jgi:hypothetical protein
MSSRLGKLRDADRKSQTATSTRLSPSDWRTMSRIFRDVNLPTAYGAGDSRRLA